jgi:hypothetical protein
MSSLQKVLVVDSGERLTGEAVSVQLAEMGVASVTAPFDAAEDVLALMPSPAAVVLQIPRTASVPERARYLALADRLRKSSIPVLVMGEAEAGGGRATRLQGEFGTQVLSQAAL